MQPIAKHVVTPLLALENVSKSYRNGSVDASVLRAVSFYVSSGEMCSIMGTSGSGKSTLMNIMGLLDRPSAGRLVFRGQDLGSASADELADIRNREIGFVFQAFHLLPRLSARDNVALPLLYRGIARPDALAEAKVRLEQVGLGHRTRHRPEEMSGGQRQRVAIARALVGRPSMLLADEPTGNLDSESAQDIMALLTQLNEDSGTTVVIITHDPSISARCRRRVVIHDGRLTEDTASQPVPA